MSEDCRDGPQALELASGRATSRLGCVYLLIGAFQCDGYVTGLCCTTYEHA